MAMKFAVRKWFQTWITHNQKTKSARSAVGETHPQTTVVKDNGIDRVDVGRVVAVTEVEISRIPHTQRGCQFKEQLKEIDVALCGDTADTTNHDLAEQSTGMSKAIQTKVHSTHAQVKEEGSDSHNGTQGEQNNNTMTLFGPQALNGPATQAQVNLPPLSSFIMGLTSSSCSAKPKLKKCNQATLKKGRVGPTMQRKENNLRRGINMENCSGLGTGTMMDVEQTKKSGKHRARSPLKNLSELLSL
ncbi:hypothetical protein CFP56_038413 [Quercus suber]|uniref:Uncharacterized protein n=1 Tax=Quercus suber TaxID=58331 RepID=A0AAW0J2B8_QUESU